MNVNRKLPVHEIRILVERTAVHWLAATPLRTLARAAIMCVIGVIAAATISTALAQSSFIGRSTDLNGDGHNDILTLNQDRSVSGFLMNGNNVTSTGNIIPAESVWAVTQMADFNGDGMADLVLRDHEGSVAIWLMNGLAATSKVTVLGPNSGWRVSQTADLNGDGKADLIWQHTDGAIGAWIMNGASLVTGAGLLGPGSGWTVSQIGDLNGDGKADLIWRHDDGAVAAWLMNGISFASGGSLLGGNSGWRVSHAADFNGDGNADVLWQHTDGSTAMWLMNGALPATGVGSTASLMSGASGWNVTHAGDLDGNGTSDLIWRHTDGSAAAWLMNGTAFQSGAVLLGASSGWTVQQVADVNGDVKADLIWQRTTGEVATWTMNGLAFSGGAVITPSGVKSLIPTASSSALAHAGARLTYGPIIFPNGFMKSIKDYGAKGDGVTDDTAAIQAALNDGRRNASGAPIYTPPDQLNGRPKGLYFPAGTYLISNTVDWYGCCVTLQGQGVGATIIKLKPNSAGFQNPQSPKPMIQTESGNMSFRQNVWDMQILVGNGNPGAIALDHISNNSGTVRNVLLKSEDGQGVTGLELTRAWPGPCMYKNVEIEGFDYGIRINYIEYSTTYENITLRNQRVAAVVNNDAVMAIKNLVSINRVPVFKNNDFGRGLVTLLDSHFAGGSRASSAFLTASSKDAFVYLRNVTAEGYQTLVKNDNTFIHGLNASEWYSSSKSYSLYSANPKPQMLKLPVQETPSFHDNNPANWARISCTGYDCQVSQELQAALNSGKSTVYFPFGVRLVYHELAVTVPATVKRIIGFSGVINTDSNGINGGGIRFIVSTDNPEPLVIEQFGYGIKVEHRGKRPVAMKYGIVYEYTALAGAGDLYAEDMQMDGFTIQSGQRFWARHINNEQRNRTKIINNGTMWILGMKTEGQQTVIDARGGATEYIGGLLYPATNDMPAGEIAFKLSNGARGSFLYSNIVYTTRNYDIQVEENRSGDVRRLTTQAAPERTRLFVSGN
jgi:hypothetical protein